MEGRLYPLEEQIPDLVLQMEARSPNSVTWLCDLGQITLGKSLLLTLAFSFATLKRLYFTFSRVVGSAVKWQLSLLSEKHWWPVPALPSGHFSPMTGSQQHPLALGKEPPEVRQSQSQSFLWGHLRLSLSAQTLQLQVLIIRHAPVNFLQANAALRICSTFLGAPVVSVELSWLSFRHDLHITFFSNFAS